MGWTITANKDCCVPGHLPSLGLDTVKELRGEDSTSTYFPGPTEQGWGLLGQGRSSEGPQTWMSLCGFQSES